METRSGDQMPPTDFQITGPHSQAIRFRYGTVRQWAIYLHPLGWKKLIGRPAAGFANGLYDGFNEETFAPFRPLANSIFSDIPDPAAELQRIFDFLLSWDDKPDPHDDLVLEIFVSLLDPQLSSVGDLAEQTGISRRTLERMCNQHFGFSPKLLLRRQRFIRSLSDFTLDPSHKWIGAIDAAYYDQAQFVREFRHFMGMSPSQYAKLGKPVVSAVMTERDRYARELVRSLQEDGDCRDYGIGA